MVNPQPPGANVWLQMTQLSSNLYMCLFSLPSQKDKKTDRGLHREQKQIKIAWQMPGVDCHPCSLLQVFI